MAALWLAALTLFMKVAVPAGFMPVFAHGSVRMELCSGYGPERMADMPTPGAGHGKSHGPDQLSPCGFAGHAPPAMAGADPILLATALSFVFAAVFIRRERPRARRVAFLRPHLRGPPAIA